VLCFFGTAGIEKNANALAYMTGDLRHHFDDSNVSFFGVSIDPADKAQGRVQQRIPGIRYFWDINRDVSCLYGAIRDGEAVQTHEIIYHPFTLVLDPGLRVIAAIPLADVTQHNTRLTEVLTSLPPIDEYAGVALNAPVLIIPRVFEPQLCQTLIALYNQQGGKESGSMIERDGQTIGKIDYGFKRRKDCEINDEQLRAAMRSRIQRRIVPEIHKAFQFHATHIERYIVACYDGEHHGFFRAHRDNTTKGTAHRRFACTINLNTEEYDGGELRFPEFGSRTYRAPTGGAVIFSCSMLHEATPVTRGRRYATLPFLYDAAAAKIRDDNRRYLSGEVVNLEEQSTAPEQSQHHIAPLDPPLFPMVEPVERDTE
jgi:predicted 2-oxoglutarate/Fe(II)-dependent dioxygenase YbiX/peroxiredoxin